MPVTSSSATRRILGSHTPIHVPRASQSVTIADAAVREEMEQEEDEPEPLPYYRHPKNKGRESVFRSSQTSKNGDDTLAQNSGKNDEEERDLRLSESNAHEILLSLSKSFDRFEGKVKFASEEVNKRSPSGSNNSNNNMKESNNNDDNRPKSPEGPPPIQHWHKQSPSNSFEPQPSPLKLSASIDLSSSFTLFSQSFDANLEGLLGPTASFGLGPAPSFGLGPMRSLSFGLGLGIGNGSGGADDQGEDAHTSARLEAVDNEDKRKKHDDDDNNDTSPMQLALVETKRTSSQINISENKAGNSSVTVLINARRVASPVAVDRRHTAEAEEAVSSQKMVLRPRAIERSGYSRDDRGSAGPHQAETGRKKSSYRPDKPSSSHQQQSRKMEYRLFGAMESHSAVFNLLSFLLPGAKAIFTRDSRSHHNTQPTEEDTEVARRRVNSALCAFGGMAVPSSSEVAGDDFVYPKRKRGRIDEAQRYYNESLAGRYFEDEDRLSWEVEEFPPIRVSESDEDDDNSDTVCSRVPLVRNASNDDDKQQTLARNIGVMVYPAVNAYTAIEPGIITPALNEVNSNISDNNEKTCPPEATPAKSQNESYIRGNSSFTPMVSPEFSRPGPAQITSQSSSTMDREETPQRSVNYAGGAWMSNHQSPRKVSPSGNHPEIPTPTDLLFVDMQELQPEQYRIVAPKKRFKSSSSTYCYPPLPLPYAQRKRISNAMFSMSKSIPGLTDECASVLGEARKKDAWDLAVAQLMTQVIVVTHCSVEDSRLDGLSKYLLTLGIAC